MSRVPHRRAQIALALAWALASCATPTATGPGGPGKPAVRASAKGSAATGTPSPGEPGATPTPGTAVPGATPGPGLTPAPPVATATPGPLPPAVLPAARLAGRVVVPSALAADVGGRIVANNGGGLVSNNGGGLISNNGGGLVSNNGGGLISDKGIGATTGSRYALLQTAAPTVALAGVRVAVYDAAGNPVLGADGKPLETTTDETGRYAFQGELPARHMVVRAADPGARGTLGRIVAPDLREADLDLASTLVTDYVLDRYVATQADRQATLDKLPAAVEADTVMIAGKAAAAAPPVALTTAETVKTLDALRRADKALDDQMEVVRKLLIAAGVAELGRGLPANEVFMPRVMAIAAAADGTAYLYAPDDNRIWRVDPGGTLQVAVGSATDGLGTSASSGPRVGEPADRIGLGYVPAMTVDAAGRLVFLEYEHGIFRVEAGGKLAAVLTQAEIDAAFGKGTVPFSFVLAPDGTPLLANDGALWALASGPARRKLADLPAEARGALRLGRDAQGRVLVEGGEQIWRVDPADGSVVVAKAKDEVAEAGSQFGDRNDKNLDRHGNWFYVGKADRKVHVRRPDGRDEALPLSRADMPGLGNGWEGADGKLYVVACSFDVNTNPAIVYRIDPATPGAPTILAGRVDYPADFRATGAFPLQAPFGLDVTPDGELLVCDNGALLRIKPGGGAAVLVPGGTLVGGAAAEFTAVRRMPDGKLLLHASTKSAELLVERDEAGAMTVRVQVPKRAANLHDASIHAFDVAADGTIVYSLARNDQAAWLFTKAKVLTLAPGQVSLFAKDLLSESVGLAEVYKLRVDAAGQVHVLGLPGVPNGKATYFRGPVAGPLAEAPAGTPYPDLVDAKGRALSGDGLAPNGTGTRDREIRRFGADGAETILAGKGGTFFAGEGLDDSVGLALDLRYDAAGNLYYRDPARRQVRRIPAEKLPP